MKNIMMTTLLALSAFGYTYAADDIAETETSGTQSQGLVADNYDEIDWYKDGLDIIDSKTQEQIISAGTKGLSKALGEGLDAVTGFDGTSNIVRGFGQIAGYNSVTDMLVREGLRGREAPAPKPITLDQVAQGITTAAKAIIPGVGAAEYLAKAAEAETTLDTLAASNQAAVSYLPGGGLLVKGTGWLTRTLFNQPTLTHTIAAGLEKVADVVTGEVSITGRWADEDSESED